MTKTLTREEVGAPEEPDYDYQPDDWYDVDAGF